MAWRQEVGDGLSRWEAGTGQGGGLGTGLEPLL